MDMAQEHIEVSDKLDRWLNIGERDAPVAFTGRDREIALAIRQLTTWQQRTSRGRTVIALGAPGAGKTAMLYEIGRRLPEVRRDATAIYMPTPWVDEDVPGLIEELAIIMMGVDATTLRSTRTQVTTAGVKVMATMQHGEPRSESPPRLNTWSAFEQEFSSLAERARPTLLLVDEVQRMGTGEATRNLLYYLHDQSTFPVVLVCSGLSTSASHLRGLGLSRVDEGKVLHIQALDVSEAGRCLEESFSMMADDVGIEGHPDRWARQLASATHGWPQHITCHIRAVATALGSSGRLAFDGTNLDEARRMAAINMCQYYEQRLETSRTHATIVFAVQEATKDGKTQAEDAADVVERVVPTLSGSRRAQHIARFRDAMQCVQQMLHAGVVSYSGNTTLSPLTVPIPSLAAHVASLLSTEQRKGIRRLLGGKL